MQSRILSRRDIDFLIHEWLDVGALTQRPHYAEHTRETLDAAIETCAKIASDHFAPINRLLDTEEPRFDGERVHSPEPLKRALKVFTDAGLMAAGFDFEYGGMQLPYTVERACFAWFNAASIGGAAYPFLTMGNANLLLAHGSPEQVDTYVRPMLEGRWFGTMCLSEPQAGSSLSDIRTRAERQPDGSFRIFGNKMWISGGEQDITENIVHLVLAKIPDEQGRLVPGVKGISLFVVPKVLVNADGSLGERNDVALAGLNHKMGYRGITNTLLNFGEGRHTPGGAAGAVGWLVGKEQQGLSCMFHMMNEARIGVGMGAAVLGYTAYLHALDYARNRPQGRPPRDKDPSAPQVSIVEHADVRRMLLAAKAYAEGGLALNLYCARLVDEQRTAAEQAARDDANLLLELLTPVCKSWPSQWCQEANSLAIQVHGGYGYTRDYMVEQFYRDQRLNPIHEGTHGIQGLDLLGRKVRMNGGRALALFAGAVGATAARAGQAGGEWAAAGQAIIAARERLDAVAARLHGLGDLDRTLANASVFLEAFGHVAVAWIWLEQALCARAALERGGAQLHADEQAFYSGKLQAARFFLRWELPKTGPMIDLLDTADTTTLDMRDAWF
ncbi:acyl-CoA dehydrogenase [Quisquiliibacterium transsilvanicum]|uniref:Alkylation response protein AidB-like acyl-CoA dehydrogenase n=1 Tax=Quisquiliibacterium transsilvanicum TaxID=1549638 RepID=A0A7W8HEC6_9BURK|nr:acyl-CoA dehydrogenase [Quisquiliibacterium transsilvanicum]MBB5270410.1 alkylation response protein AidB-like acyl-CoA dehydrogenase [Quisquiliibacterium transsilvanicum]